HTYEAYQATETENYKPTEKWRTRDENHNMIAVGDALARALTARGFIVVHDTTAFEPPTLSTAYKRSLAMLRTRLDAGERYDYWLDVHRDAYSESYRGANSVETEEEAPRASCCWWARARARRGPALTSDRIGRKPRTGAGRHGGGERPCARHLPRGEDQERALQSAYSHRRAAD
ncbi:MAG: stage II sporulation protein P, partial [Christensenellales bacterium]